MNCYWFSIIVRPRQLFNGIIVIIKIIIIIIINFTRSFKPVRCRCRLHNSISISLFAVTLPIFLKRRRRETRYSKNEMMENGKLCGIFVVLHFPPTIRFVLIAQNGNCIQLAVNAKGATMCEGEGVNVNWYTHRHEWRWYIVCYTYILSYISLPAACFN